MRFKTKDKFSYEDFKNPPKEYRGVPFWSWNCSLSEKKVTDQLRIFEEMGFGGAVAHSRNGLMDEYMGEKFMDMIKLSSDVSEERDLDLWLYDEDRWPSGCAGGLITIENIEYRQKNILFTKKKVEELPASKGIFRREVASFVVTLDSEGFLADYRFAEEGEDAIHVYEMIAADNPRYNGGANVDTLNKEAIAAFIESTYVKYKDELGAAFGKRVSSIFTDEPQVDKKFPASFSDVESFGEASYPWTSDFADTYMAEYGEDIIAHLPQLVFELPEGKMSTVRYCYCEHLSERFRQAFTKQIGDWCRENGINFTGHLLYEGSLLEQHNCVGDLTRCYTDFDIPGIDVLCAKYEYTTAKQTQSVARQDGKRWIMSELYGVTGWQSDFRDYIHWGNWQAALGVTIRVPHLNWMSMLGAGKRDYPACFGYQAPWYKEFKAVEDYFARLHTVLTAGDPVARIGVIHPIESFWFCYGIFDKTGDICRARNKDFLDFAQWLLFSSLDFDYLNESLLPNQYKDGSVGEMKYDAVVVPDCLTLRASTIKILEDMKARGVKIIFAGGIPLYVDGIESGAASELAKTCEKAEFTKEGMLRSLECVRKYELFRPCGRPADEYISHERVIDGDTWVFLTPAKHIADKENVIRGKHTFKIKGEYSITLYDAMTGERRALDVTQKNGSTSAVIEVGSYDSILLCMSKTAEKPCAVGERRRATKLATSFSSEFLREEPNVLLLDMGEYSFDGENYFGVEEILRIDTAARKHYSLPTIMGKFAYQPWSIKDDVERPVWVRFRFRSEIETECEISFERATEITLNGVAADMTPCGWYVDEDFAKIKLPSIKKGDNELVVKMTIGKIFGVEPMYLLGDFDVELSGIEKTIRAPRRVIGFDTVTRQGMPFYSGNIVYKREIETPECSLTVSVGKYRGDLVGVKLDGKYAGNIILPPYRLTIENVAAGKHTLELILYGNRHNTFGSLHCCVEDNYFGPTHWQKNDPDFVYEYQLRDMGIMKAPEIFIEENKSTH